MITVLSLALEMKSFVNVSSTIIDKAKASNINAENTPEFNTLVNDWKDGHYDEDPEYVVNEIESLLK